MRGRQRAWVLGLAGALCASGTARAGALDLPDVGGAWGTPASGGAPALWWNPATMSVRGGTSFLLDVGPIFGSASIDRDDPAYGDFSGKETWKVITAAPFAGLTTDAGVPGLGLGAAFYVPYARAGSSTSEPGPGSTHLRGANILVLNTSVGISYAWRDLIGVGVSGTWMHGQWYARLDFASAPLLADEISATLPFLGEPQDIYSDGVLEDPGYLTTLEFQTLKKDTGTFQAGFFVRPHPRVVVSASYVHHANLEHRGNVQMDIPCPPEEDTVGRTALNLYGLCGVRTNGDAMVEYWYPMRVHAGVQVQVSEDVVLEAMGGFSRWSEYRDFHIVVDNLRGDGFDLTPEAAELLKQDRRWARGNKDTFWVGVDAKGRVGDHVTVGGRLTFDRHAAQAGQLSPNTIDFDVIRLMAMGAYRVSDKVPLTIGLSYTEDIALPRTETDSEFGVAIDPAHRKEDRLFYTEMNGRYTGSVRRVGVSILGQFDAPKKKPRR